MRGAAPHGAGGMTSTRTPSASPTVATTTTTTAPDPETELVAAVRAFWDLYVELGGRTGTFDPNETRERLEERTTGRELQQLFEVGPELAA